MLSIPSSAHRLLIGVAVVTLAGCSKSPTDPGTNLALSALYLGLLRDRFGSDAAALAAYNAGPGAPARWLGSRRDSPLDEWVENVPYKETRIYLKTVLSTREVYRRRIGLSPSLDPATLVPASVAGVAF